MKKQQIRIEDGEVKADFRICSTERQFPDDIEGECSKCKCPVFYRPHPPFLIPFLCWECAKPGLEDAELICSSQTAKEIADYFLKPPTP